MQRWLSLRLDLFGNLLILGIALFGAGFRNTVQPAKTGGTPPHPYLTLAYLMRLQWSCRTR
jgi:hypothetical protein